MTPPERADYLIKEFGDVEKAIDHSLWVRDGAHRSITKEYWQEVIIELNKKKDELS